MSAETFAERPAVHLARLLKERGMSQRQLALAVWPEADVGKSCSLIQHWMSGSQTRWSSVEDVADYFGIDPGEFYQPTEGDS